MDISLTKRPQLDEVRDRDYSFKQNGKIVSVNTLNGRIECEIAMPGFEKYLDDEMLGTMYVSGVPNPSYQSKHDTTDAKKAKGKKTKKQTN